MHVPILYFSGDHLQDMVKQAVEVRKKAYVPYSKFQVGSALLTEQDEKVYTGCNIENATYGPTICAERTAIAKAVSDGYLKIKTVVVVAHQESFTAPCGVCRQMLSEFRDSNGDIEIYLTRPTLDKVLCTKLTELLPLSFVSSIIDSIK